MKLMCKRLGMARARCSSHTLRHPFAELSSGWRKSLLPLPNLGPPSVTTTEKYLQSLGVEDLQAVHDRLSLLNPAR
jgi:hypothetical protein